MNSFHFSGDGLVLDGTTWYNPKTGDSFKVRGNYFEDNVMKIQSTDGRTFTLDHMNDYVKWTGSNPPPAQPEVPKNVVEEELPAEVQSLLAGEDESWEDIMIPGDISYNTPTQPAVQKASTSVPKKTTNYDIIDRALSKTNLPIFKPDIKWTKFPQREIDMLNDVMDIPIDEVIEYYILKTTSDMGAFMENFKQSIQEFINTKMNPAPVAPKKIKTNGTKTKPV